jgi:hypothetical protein
MKGKICTIYFNLPAGRSWGTSAGFLFSMKKVITFALLAIVVSGCATVFGGKVTATQKTKPQPGQTKRSIRPGFFVLDLMGGGLFLIVDFATGAIYRPESKTKTASTAGN